MGNADSITPVWAEIFGSSFPLSVFYVGFWAAVFSLPGGSIKSLLDFTLPFYTQNNCCLQQRLNEDLKI